MLDYYEKSGIRYKTMTDTLFYDGNCPMCSREIGWIKRFKDESLNLVDIHSRPSAALLPGTSRDELLSVLHLVTSDDTVIKGLDATVGAWRHTPFGWLLLPLRWPGVKQVTDRIYKRWAARRACSLGYESDCKL